jgi:regulator of protease activity HflC (stomatin/prohibitin superfamily)
VTGIESVIFLALILSSAVVAILLALFIYFGIQFISQGKQCTVERFGKYNRILEPGFNWRWPIIEQISNEIDMREQVMDVPRQEVITQDNAMITVDGVVFYRVFDAKKSTYEVSNLSEAIMHLTITNLRTVMGSMNLDDLLSKRDEINEKLFKVVDEATDPWGIKIIRIEIKDISPQPDLVEAMARQMKAEREKRAAILEAEGQRKSAVEKAEGEKQALILKAEGEKISDILKAEGFKAAEILKAQARREAELLDAESRGDAANHDAQARERLAAAEAKATMLVSQALMKGDIQAINYFIALRYIEALQSIASADNQKLIMIPLEAANLIGSISGISDIAKEVLANKMDNRNITPLDPKDSEK